jgi:hypothetical protein
LANRQIQPVRNRDYAIIRQPRSRGVLSQVMTVTLQPTYFFRALPNVSDTRQWFWVAALILILIGLSAVRQESLNSTDGAAAFVPPVIENPSPDTGRFDQGGFPEAFPGETGNLQQPGAPTDITSTWTTALISGSHIILSWLILSVLLSEVSLFNGVSPSLGQNLQIAIWTTVPLGVMAGLQLIFFAAGGTLREPGLMGLLTYWEGYQQLPTFVQSLLLSLTSRLTIFWLWTLALLYIGARNALRGKRWAVALVVVMWVAVLVVLPVLTGAIAAPEQASNITEPNIIDQLPEQREIPEELVLPDAEGSPPEATVETGS